MIVAIILNLLYYAVYLLTYPLRLFPDVSLPVGVANSIQMANTYIASVDFVLPVSTFLTIFGIFISVEVFILTYKAMNWLIRKIPSVN